ncbi:MAG TPA: ABC-2 family transporter protein [Rectinemataceae bacterium]|nr:ABC-2 family transporter protein [Rectinemataceae bacterium]
MNRLGVLANKYATAASVSLRNRLAYFGNFLGSLFTYALFIFVFSRIWGAVFSAAPGRATIAGYDRAMCIWYFIVAEVPMFGFGHFFYSLAQDMKSGQVAYLLGRPYSFVGYHFSEGMGSAVLESLILLAEGCLLGLLFVGSLPVVSALQAAAVVVSLLLAGSLQFLLQFALAMTAFWFEENTAFFWIFQKLALVVGTLIPIEFLPAAAQRLAWLTPFPLLSYAPARIAIAFDHQSARLLIIQAAWLVGAAALCRLLFGVGRRMISSQGG